MGILGTPFELSRENMSRQAWSRLEKESDWSQLTGTIAKWDTQHIVSGLEA